MERCLAVVKRGSGVTGLQLTDRLVWDTQNKTVSRKSVYQGALATITLHSLSTFTSIYGLDCSGVPCSIRSTLTLLGNRTVRPLHSNVMVLHSAKHYIQVQSSLAPFLIQPQIRSYAHYLYAYSIQPCLLWILKTFKTQPKSQLLQLILPLFPTNDARLRHGRKELCLPQLLPSQQQQLLPPSNQRQRLLLSSQQRQLLPPSQQRLINDIHQHHGQKEPCLLQRHQLLQF